MAWVVNGLRLPSFRGSFDAQLRKVEVLENTPIKLRLPTGRCSILKTWADSTVGVYMDFGDKPFADDRFCFSKPILWHIVPGSYRERQACRAYVANDSGQPVGILPGSGRRPDGP